MPGAPAHGTIGEANLPPPAGVVGSAGAAQSLVPGRTDRTGLLPGCDLVRTTAFSMSSPPITAQDGITVRAAGSAQTQPVSVQLAPSAAQVTVLCR